MRKLKLMADYYCFPLWRSDEAPENVDPRSLPLSLELVSDLLAWAARWDAILVPNDPGSSDFGSPEEENRFNADGRALATRLAVELGDAFEVTFVDTDGKKIAIDLQQRAEKSTPSQGQQRAGAPRTPKGFQTLMGPIRSIDEVAGLRRMSASGASFLLTPHPVFTDDQVISLPNAQRVCVEFPGRRGIILSPSITREYLGQLLSSIHISFVEFNVGHPPAIENIEFARNHGLEILASGLDVEHDDDPEWLTARLEDASNRFHPDLFVVTLVPSHVDAYGWFTEEAGAHPDDLTQAKVNAVLRTHPVLVNMELGEHSPQVLRELFPAARGSYTYIGTPRDDGGTPAFSLLPP